MSRKDNCWDNAPVESFFGTLKRELVFHEKYLTRLKIVRNLPISLSISIMPDNHAQSSRTQIQ
jgi:transposase InsO family protein